MFFIHKWLEDAEAMVVEIMILSREIKTSPPGKIELIGLKIVE